MRKYILTSLIVLISALFGYKYFDNRQLDQDKCVILLTMTIDPQNTIATARVNIDDRINDYKKSLARWAELPYKVVVVENSGYGNPFGEILKDAKNITYVSKKLPQIPARGKGYGEAQILKYAMDHLITDDDIYIFKFTGRYAPINNLSTIISLLKKYHPEAIVRYSRSEWFVARRNFFNTLANNCIATCDDTKGYTYYFEGHLKALSNAPNVIKFDKKIHVLPTYTGSDNKKITKI